MADPRLGGKTANEILLDRAIRHAVYLTRVRTQIGNELVGELDVLLVQILRQVDTAVSGLVGRGFGVNSRSRKRIQNMLRKIARLTNRRYSELRKSLAETMIELGKMEAKFQVSAFQSSLPEGITLGFVVPPAAFLNTIVTQRPMSLNGRSGFASDFFKRLPQNLLRDVEGAVNGGLAAGETPAQIRNRLAGVRGTEGVFGRTRRDLMTVTRTAVNHTSSQAREMTYDSNRDVVKGVKFLATLDARTSPICRSLDGQVFPVDEGERPPMHHQCRSTTVPILKSFEELGLGDKFKDAPAGTRASLDGQVPGDLTYTEWLRGQPRAIQDLALGPKRAELFRSGTISSMRDLLGPLNRPLTLEQLAKLEGI